MGIKTIESQDNEGHIQGCKQSEFHERRAQERLKQEDHTELKRKDVQDDLPDVGRV